MSPLNGPQSGLRRRALVLAALAVASGLIAPAEVVAHAELRSSDPATNATLVSAPDALTLEFSEAVDPATAAIQVLDEHAAAVPGLGPAAVDRDGARLRVPLPELAPGEYTVDYRVTSAVDGHVTTGTFAFLVDPTGTLPAPAGAPAAQTPASDAATVLARWVALLSLLVLAGTAIFWLSARRTIGTDLPAPWLAIAATAFLAFAGHAAYLSLAARPLADPGGGHGGHGGLTGFPLDFAAPFGWTPFGTAMRVVLAATALVFVLAAAHAVSVDEARRAERQSGQRIDRVALMAVLVTALVALAGASFAAHPAAYGGPLFAVIDFLHLAGVAAWLGALPGAGLLVWQTRRHGDRRRANTMAAEALRGHARMALAAAPIVALTGIANSPLVIGEARGLIDSGYGNLLLGKALLFSAALGLGAASYLLLRRASTGRAAAILAGQAILGVAAVLFAASMASLHPAAGRAPATAPSGIGTVHLSGAAGELTIRVGVSRPAPGPQRYQVSVADAATGAPIRDVERVTLVLAPPEGSAGGEREVELQPQESGGGIWATAGAYTPIVGDWRLDATVRLADGTEATASFRLPVVEAPAPTILPPPDTGVGVPPPLAALYGVLPRGALGWLPALALLISATAVAAYERRSSRPSRTIAGLRAALVTLAVVAGLGAGARTAVEAANAPPPSAAGAVNPVAATTESIQHGQQLYAANCAVCHGPDGAGDGPAAPGMLPPPGSLPPVVREATDGALAYRIATGMAGTRMPAFAATLSDDDRWDLVNYLRARWGSQE